MAKFIDDAELEQALADVIQTEIGDLKDYHKRIVKESNQSAYNEIVTALACRGYTAVQIAAWDRGAEFEKSIGLFWCSVHGAAYFKDTEGELLKNFDRREELKTLCITNGGVIVDPEVTDEEDGPVGYGRMNTGYEVFKPLQRAWRVW